MKEYNKEKNNKKLSSEGFERVANLFKALAEPARLQILDTLQSDSLSVGEIVESTKIPQATVSKHLKTLYENQLLSKSKEGVKVFYQVSDPVVFELCALMCGRLHKELEDTASPEYFKE